MEMKYIESVKIYGSRDRYLVLQKTAGSDLKDGLAAEEKIAIIKGRRKQEWGKGELRGREGKEGRGRPWAQISHNCGSY